MTATASLSPTTRLPGEVRARVTGLGLVGAAVLSGWFFVLRSLGLAEAGAARVTIEWKVFVFAPCAALAGLALVFGGARVLPLLGRPPRGGKETAAALGLFVLAMALGDVWWWWTGVRLHALGYADW